MRSVLSILFSLLLALSLPAQNLNFAHLNNDNGLSSNMVGAICKDSKGFVWIGTQHGLNRYDGYEFKQFYSVKGDSTSLYSNIIKDIKEDANGNLWVQCNNQLIVYNHVSERFIRDTSPLLAKMGMPPLPVFVEVDKQKNFYSYYKSGSIYKYDVKRKTTSYYEQSSTEPGAIKEGRIVSICPVPDGFWVLFRPGFMQHYNEDGKVVDISDDYISAQSSVSVMEKKMFVDRDGDVWVYPGVNDNGVMYYNVASRKWASLCVEKNQSEALPNIISDVAQDSEGRIWIASNHAGITVLDKRTMSSVILVNDPSYPNSIAQNSVTALYYDSSGIMWVGTYKNGVSFYHSDLFKFESAPASFFENNEVEIKDCNCISEDLHGNLWLGTDGGGLVRYNKTLDKYSVYKTDDHNPHSISSNVVVSLARDSKGDIWVGTYFGGLNRFDGESFTRYMYNPNDSNSISNNSVYGVCEDKNGYLWVATLGGGVNRIDRNREKISHYTRYRDGLLSNYINDMGITDDRSQILINTPNGINILDVDKMAITSVFSTDQRRELLSESNVNCSIIDSRGLLWLGSNSGINIYDRQKNRVYAIDVGQGLPNSQVATMVEDNSGNIWVGTSSGLACIYPQKRKDNEYFFPVVEFDKSDGVSNSSFNRHAVYKSSSGKIYMGTTKGYIVIDPSRFQFKTEEPKIIFTDLVVQNQTIGPGEKYHKKVILPKSISELSEISMKYTVKNFSVCFSTLNFLNPGKVRYKYMLKGLNNEWTEIIGEEGRASFSNLNQGTYELIVYAANSWGEWNKEPSVMKIKIVPPFWKTGWAYLIYSILLISTISYTYMYFFLKAKEKYKSQQKLMEVQHMHDLDEMKLSFFTNISHEFRTPLSLILNPAEKLLKETRSEEERSMLMIIYKNAISLLELVNQLLDFRKLDSHNATINMSAGDVVVFVRDICNSFIDMANQKKISLVFSSSVNELSVEFDQEKLKKIVVNLLSNAFKFTGNQGKIEVNLNIIQILNDNRNLLKISVSDTGIGIEKENFSKIFERFIRIENHRGEQQPGTGIGLHIVSEYVKLLNGEIQVESAVGKGSTFVVTLPIGASVPKEVLFEPSEQTEQIEEQIEGDGNVWENNKDSKKWPLVLVVDDNLDFRNFMVVLLHKSYRVIAAANGKAAHQMILEHIPDLVISDVMMPEMDGFELCRIVKEDIRTSHIPIILLTAKTSEESKYEGVKSGADDYISKPFNTELLALKVAQMMERKQKLQNQMAKKIDINLSEMEVTDLNEEFIKKAVLLVDDNLGDPEFSIELMSKDLGMSRAYLYKKMQSLIGKSPTEFVRHIRLRRAATLLEKSGMIVKEVAFNVGFNDTKYFRKYFKEEFGVSPNEYRKKYWPEK